MELDAGDGIGTTPGLARQIAGPAGAGRGPAAPRHAAAPARRSFLLADPGIDPRQTRLARRLQPAFAGASGGAGTERRGDVGTHPAVARCGASAAAARA